MDLPSFDGTDPLGWIFKANQFFTFHQTPPEQRIQLASFSLEGQALAWFQWMHNNGLLTSWDSFLRALELRFAPSKFDDPIATLCKLSQTHSLQHYLSEFEKLSNRISGYPASFYLSCFISGLKPHLRREVTALQPSDLNQAIAFAKLHEDKHSSNPSFNRFPRSSPPPNPPPLTSPKPLPPLLPTPLNKLPIKRLTETEMQARREKNLCYNCDEQYTRGHRCKSQFLLLVSTEPDDDPDTPPDPDPRIIDEPSPESGLISLHALSGQWAPRTLRLIGSINGYKVQVLVDSGATHNFIQSRVAHFLQLQNEPTSTPLRVMVGNGDFLPCSTFCPKAQLHLASLKFSIDLYPLELSGTDIVLGVHWLTQVSPFVMDYNGPFMRFMWEGQLVELKGETGPTPSPISIHQLRRLQQTNSVAALFQLTLEPTGAPFLHSYSATTTSTPPFPTTTITHTPTSDQPHIQALLHKYSSLFQPPTTLPPSRPTNHHITLHPNTAPIVVRPYRYPHYQKHEIEQQVQRMLDSGFIKPSTSPFSSPVLLVKKKDGTWRFCVDYCALNAATVKDKFPIPTVDELLDELGTATWFSKLDLFSGFHQILMFPGDCDKTAFRTHNGHFEFRVMPFGLCNAPSTFQATMNDLFRPHLRQFIIVFFDDILVYSPTLELHISHLECAFQLLVQNSFHHKGEKCSIGKESIHYLGHIVSNKGVQPDPNKIHASLRGFLGLTGFYRRFVKGYASIASALTDLLKRDKFLWKDNASQAFQRLKEALTNAPVLSLPRFDHMFIVQTDASGSGMGAVLSQNGHPIAYFSKQFCPKLQSSSTYIRELCAITSAVQKWRQYLLGRRFIIQTDQKSIKELLSQTVLTPDQQHYLSKLLGYDFEIQYRPGKCNSAADALSRLSQSQQEHCLLILSIPQLDFLSDLKQYLSTNDEFLSLKQRITTNPINFPLYSLTNGLILFKQRIWIPASCPFIPTLLHEYHSTPLAGHPGVARTFGKLAANFFWAKMRQDVHTFVTQCEICQQTKIPAQKPAGLLQPIPPPTKCWEDLSLDFIVGLPPYQGNSTILVVVDRFSKAAHFGMLPRSFSASKVADLFVHMICKLHGLPKSLISDRDPVFLSQFWRELFRLSGTKLRMSTTYHPQSDGQTEVINKTLQQYLRCFVHHKPSLWGKFLPWAEWCFNTTINISIKMTPFEVVYGHPPPSIPQGLSSDTSNAAVQFELQSRADIIRKLNNNLQKAQADIKRWADTNRRDLQFQPGDWVYVRLRPHCQVSVAGHYQGKLQKRFFGPFQVLERIGQVAYKLELPSTAKIHNVFHVSFLRQHKGNPPTTSSKLPLEFNDNQPILEPIAILNTKPNSDLVLVQWRGLPPEDATWEPWGNLKEQFHLEDKVLLHPEGDERIIGPNPIEYAKIDDSPSTTADSEHGPNNALDASSNRPRRAIRQPIYLRDFVTK
ncbi:hypothetical protein V8G54_027488 [Vigna mungo]|uniref:Ty3/gypsy retrotransposon protein n=1 Tax=Vigna mungo TaxID=3915 RepID=A0AAQ3RN41_VIGMU